MKILTRNGDANHRECTSSPGMGMCFIWNGDVTNRKCTSSSGMHIVYTGCNRKIDYSVLKNRQNLACIILNVQIQNSASLLVFNSFQQSWSQNLCSIQNRELEIGQKTFVLLLTKRRHCFSGHPVYFTQAVLGYIRMLDMFRLMLRFHQKKSYRCRVVELKKDEICSSLHAYPPRNRKFEQCLDNSLFPLPCSHRLFVM